MKHLIKSVKKIMVKADFEKIQAETRSFETLKSKFPKVANGWAKWCKSNYEEVSDLDYVYMAECNDGTQIFRIYTPGHSWFFDALGKNIGEEDGGIDDPKYKKYEDEIYEIMNKRPTNSFFKVVSFKKITAVSDLKCSGGSGPCKGDISYIDHRGFVYCDSHGKLRKQYEQCRKLSPGELQKLNDGQAIKY